MVRLISQSKHVIKSLHIARVMVNTITVCGYHVPLPVIRSILSGISMACRLDGLTADYVALCKSTSWNVICNWISLGVIPLTDEITK